MKCRKIFRIGRTVDETGKRENGRRTDLGIKTGILALGVRTAQSHRLNYSSSRIELFSPPARKASKISQK